MFQLTGDEFDDLARNLAAFRDALLPRFLFGEIRVGEPEKIVEDVS